MITGFYTGILALILVFLIIAVAQRRLRYKVGIGDGGIPDLGRRIRAHANFVETVPFLLIEMYLLETNGLSEWLLHVFGILTIASRLFHAAGLYKSEKTSVGRFVGICVTMVLMITGGGTLIWQFIS